MNNKEPWKEYFEKLDSVKKVCNLIKSYGDPGTSGYKCNGFRLMNAKNNPLCPVCNNCEYSYKDINNVE